MEVKVGTCRRCNHSFVVHKLVWDERIHCSTARSCQVPACPCTRFDDGELKPPPKPPDLRWEISKPSGWIQTATLIFKEQAGGEDYWPVPVALDKYRLRAPVLLPLGQEMGIAEIATFIGLLPKDRAEIAIEVELMPGGESPSGPRVYLRSFHRHEAQDFESWHSKVMPTLLFPAGLIVVMEAQSMEDRDIMFHGGIVLTLVEEGKWRS